MKQQSCSKLDKRVISIARNVRRRIERLAKKPAYSTSPKYLDCMCAIASYALYNELKKLGYKDVSFEVSGKEAYDDLRFEMGVHRVQRVPVTEKQGRVHTSTISVAVLPVKEITDYLNENKSDREKLTYQKEK